MGEPGLDHVLDSLRSRLAAFEDTGDPSGVFSDAATEEAALLIDAVRERTAAGLAGAWDDTALAAAGRLHWKRHLTVPPSDTVHDEAALLLFVRPFRADRSLVPEVVWSRLAGPTEEAGRLNLLETPAAEIAEVAEAAAGHGLAQSLVLPLRVAAAMLPDRHPGCAPVLSALASVHHLLHGDGHDGALDAAIEAAGRAAAVMADDWPGRAVLLSRLGLFRWERYNRDGDEAELTASEQAGRAAVRACGDGDPARPGCLHNLVIALLSRYELAPEPSVLAQALEAGREAVRTTDPARRAAPLHALSLAAALGLCFDRTGDPAALAEAERALAAVLEGAADDNPYLPLVRARLDELAHATVVEAAPDDPERPEHPPPPGRGRGPRKWRWTRAG
ncbi:hypothetical protein ACFPOI_23615 [Nonomuraea angiospora]|uniref:Uncharacterized protein n=1 Tax=Nonomuraea angiospora TaxID=46172 RepID=A0ABR9ML43_9ACTN|nr:hypothetical protein [Nonomuraea angiospora]MBE1593664.1 hypothetical protein [Nonomuraea angiospora]